MKNLKRKEKSLCVWEISDGNAAYVINAEATKKLCSKSISVDDLTRKDINLEIQKKGVDMRIVLDIASVAYKRLADKIILIAGDSDFVPAAKHARREGIDFILDPMWHTIKPSLHEHIDGLATKTYKPGSDHEDELMSDELKEKIKANKLR